MKQTYFKIGFQMAFQTYQANCIRKTKQKKHYFKATKSKTCMTMNWVISFDKHCALYLLERNSFGTLDGLKSKMVM